MTDNSKLYRVVLSEKHYGITQVALGLLDADNELSAAENEEALKAFHNNVEVFGGPIEGTPSAIRHIPMMLHIGDEHPIGFAEIVDGEMRIKIHSPLLTSAIDRLVRAEDVTELYLGVGFPTRGGTSVERKRA